MKLAGKILNGDCREILKTLPDQSVHCCVTSPPYYGLRDYGVEGQIGLEKTPEEYVNKIVEVFREVRRVLRDDGTLWLNLGDSYASQGGKEPPQSKWDREGIHDGMNGGTSRKPPLGLKSKDLIGIPWSVALALRDDGWYLRQDIIWQKTNPMPESVKDRCTKAHEYVFLLSKSEKYYFDNEAVKELSTNGKPAGNKRHKYTDAYANSDTEEHRTKAGLLALSGVKWEKRNRRSVWGVDEENLAQWLEENHPDLLNEYLLSQEGLGDVWRISTKPYKGAHFAVFPPELIEPCILAGCPEGGIVLDPFFGSGTTGYVAEKHNRNYIGIELNLDYIELATERINSSQNPVVTNKSTSRLPA